jgi:upstream activation factor subunit UAF30
MVKATSSSVPVPADITLATAAAPVVEKPKVKRAPKKEVVATKAVAAPSSSDAAATSSEVTESAVVADSSVDKSDISTELSDEITELLKTVQARSALDNTIKASIKSIEKKVARMTKLMEKCTKKRKTGLAKVSGFEKPTAISDELAKFVGEPVGAFIARTAISKKIHEYVKANNLQDPQNRRIINPDVKLKKLLKTGPGEELSYFNLQKFLKVHFKKA